MSSDSDDIDEDELLQIALREQAQRDLDYQKARSAAPSSTAASRPVSNFVQPPPSSRSNPNPRKDPRHQPPPPSRNPTAPMQQKHQQRPPPPRQQQQQQRRRVVDDDDDDSDLEMLSISSGDEDSSKDRRVAPPKGRVGRAGREDSWDGSEPDCWKRVDEAELGRRVREMRETRAVPVAEKFVQTSALSGKVLKNIQSFPRGMEFVDPLGLGIIDNKSLKLISDATESSPLKSDRDYLDSSLREKLMYFSEKFDAKLFLSRIHQDTTTEDLEAGALSLKTDLQGRTQQKKQLVKENFDCFVSCKTTIDDIESKLRRIEDDPEGSGTSHLFDSIQGVSSLANHAFQPLFERQAQAEKIRSVQGMLQRFRTLFNLPSTIRGSISKGEYDLAVREYRKAKSIVLPSHVGILKRVLEEVEKLMHEFKGMLYKSMEDPQVDLTTLENTVRLLLELEPESDPVWHHLNIQNQRIRGLLEKCTLDHELRMETLHAEMRQRALSEAKWRKFQQDATLSSLSSDAKHSHLLGNSDHLVDSQPVSLTGEKVDALRGRYIRRLTAVLTYHLPAFWKIALSVFNGKFAKVSAESSPNISASRTDERVGDGKYSGHSLEELAGMIRGTISAYETKVLNTYRDLEESNILCPYMSDTITEILKACQAFEAKESSPPVAVMALQRLHLEMTKIYVLRLCSWMRTSIEEISRDESWVPVSVLERNKSPYTISFFPLGFRSIVAAAMDRINPMIQSLKSEVTQSEDVLMQLHEIQESVRLAFLNCFLDFAGQLERLGGELSQKRSSNGSLPLQNGFLDDSEEKSPDLPGSVVDPHQQLLIVLSNIGYCKDELSYELYNKYKHVWLQSRLKEDEDSDIQDLVLSFSGLEEKVLAHYTVAKSNLIRSAAMDYLLDSGFQWGGAPPVKGVRDAAVELLHTLVAVHAEVHAGAKPLLDRTLGILVEALIDTFLSLLHENKAKNLRSMDANGFSQLTLELEYFETILHPYFTPDAQESLKSLQGMLLEKATESVTESLENPGHQRRPTRGSEDALGDDKQQGMSISPDDLIALAQQYSSELLQAELERTRVNTACFVESISLDMVPEPAKAAYAASKSPVNSPSRNYRSAQAIGSPSFTRHRR